MKKNYKIILDVIMLLLTLTLFNKQLISMKYHEVAGLLLVGIVVLHIVINMKTVVAMGRKFVKVPLHIKCGLIVDMILIGCFAWIGISGVLISRTILTNISSMNMLFKLTHMFSGALSVILLGIHIGLHICHKEFNKIISIIVFCVVLCGGIYGVINSNELRWLSMPVTLASNAGGIGSQSFNKPDMREENGDHFNNKNEGANFDSNEKGSFDAPEDNGFKGKKGTGQGTNRQPLSSAAKMQNVLMFAGMILSCTVITYWVAQPKRQNKLKQHHKYIVITSKGGDKNGNRGV